MMPSNPPPSFEGAIPGNYQRYLGPYIFEPFAIDLARRLAALLTGSALPSSSTRTAAPAQSAASYARAAPAVLECACGTGRLTRNLLQSIPLLHLTATDLNKDMLIVAQREYADGITSGRPAINIPDPAPTIAGTAVSGGMPLPNANILAASNALSFQTADMQSLPFPDRSFDAVTSQFGLMFVPDRSKALAEAYRVLKPGGYLLFSTWDSLEKNPSFNIADQLVKTYFPVDPPRFFHLPFSLDDPQQLESWTREAGFTAIHTTNVKISCTSPRAADAATGMLEGSPMYTSLNQLAPGRLPEIKSALEKALAEKFGESPLTSPMQAWVVSAQK